MDPFLFEFKPSEIKLTLTLKCRNSGIVVVYLNTSLFNRLTYLLSFEF